MEDMDNGQKVTVKELYTAIDSMRKEIFGRFDTLESQMADSFVPKPLCDERYNSLRNYVDTRMRESGIDREKLWVAYHDTEAQNRKLLWWLVGVLASVGGGTIIALVTGHLRF